MKNLLRYFSVAFGLALGVSVCAYAKPAPPQKPPHFGLPPTNDWPSRPHDWPSQPYGWPPPKSMTAPEIDPSMMMGGLALLAGTLTVLRARRRK